MCSSGAVTAVISIYNDTGAPSWAWDEIVTPLVKSVVPCIGAYNVDSSWEERWGRQRLFSPFFLALLDAPMWLGFIARGVFMCCFFFIQYSQPGLLGVREQVQRVAVRCSRGRI